MPPKFAPNARMTHAYLQHTSRPSNKRLCFTVLKFFWLNHMLLHSLQCMSKLMTLSTFFFYIQLCEYEFMMTKIVSSLAEVHSLQSERFVEQQYRFYQIKEIQNCTWKNGQETVKVMKSAKFGNPWTTCTRSLSGSNSQGNFGIKGKSVVMRDSPILMSCRNSYLLFLSSDQLLLL